MKNSLATIKDMVNSDYVRARFAEVMGDKSSAFLASVLNAIRTNPSLKDCEPNSVVSSAMVAATLDLPIDGSLGFSALVPYRNKDKIQVAQFQIMTKGFVQLALRSGQYQTINVGPVYADEFGGLDIITGDVKITHVAGGFRDRDDDKKIVGYVCFFRLSNGYQCVRYWTVENIAAHGKRYSKSYDYGLWKTNFRAMAEKTVLKNTLSKWGILSTTMQMAIKSDQAVISRSLDGADATEMDYVDATEPEQIEARPPEEIVKSADKSKPGQKPKTRPVEEIWTAILEYGDSPNLPKAANEEIAAALERQESDPEKLEALLAKLNAANK